MGLIAQLPLTKDDLAVTAAKCPIGQQQKLMPSPQYGTILLADLLLHMG